MFLHANLFVVLASLLEAQAGHVVYNWGGLVSAGSSLQVLEFIIPMLVVPRTWLGNLQRRAPKLGATRASNKDRVQTRMLTKRKVFVELTTISRFQQNSQVGASHLSLLLAAGTLFQPSLLVFIFHVYHWG